MISSRRPPTPEEIKLADSPVKALFSNMEGLVLMLYEIAYGEDTKAFLWVNLLYSLYTSF